MFGRRRRGSILAIAGVLLLAVAGATDAPGARRAAAESPALKTTYVSKAWLDPGAPAVSRLDVTGEVLDRKTQTYVYKTKAVVRRAGFDRNGSAVVLKAKNWAGALDKIDKLVSRHLKVKRRSVLRKIVSALGYTRTELRRPFPPLKVNYVYELVAIVDGHKVRVLDSTGRRAKGSKTFVQPLSAWLPPGNQKLVVESCLWPDEQHPLVAPLATAIRLWDKLSSALQLGSNLLAGAVGEIVTDALKDAVKDLGKSVVVTRLTCSQSIYRVTVRAKVPPLKGLDATKAREELKRRRLRSSDDAKIVFRTSCTGFKNTVTKQDPPPGTWLKKGETVTISAPLCVGGGVTITTPTTTKPTTPTPTPSPKPTGEPTLPTKDVCRQEFTMESKPYGTGQTFKVDQPRFDPPGFDPARPYVGKCTWVKEDDPNVEAFFAEIDVSPPVPGPAAGNCAAGKELDHPDTGYYYSGKRYLTIDGGERIQDTQAVGGNEKFLTDLLHTLEKSVGLPC